jgi:hypothetical protein
MCAPWKVVAILAAGFIAGGGLDRFADAQTPPTPLPGKALNPAFDPNAPRPPIVYQRYRRVAPNWQRFKGATKCVQENGLLACDNGYQQRVR